MRDWGRVNVRVLSITTLVFWKVNWKSERLFVMLRVRAMPSTPVAATGENPELSITFSAIISPYFVAILIVSVDCKAGIYPSLSLFTVKL